MRVTQNTMFNAIRGQLQSNTNRLLRAQEQVATQKKINRLSDNAVDGGRVLDLTTAASRSEQYIHNIDRAASLADIQDSTLGQVQKMIGRAKELLLGEANQASSSSSTREAARIEISILTSQMIQAANTRFDGQYIFSGFASQTVPFAEATVAVAPPAVAGRAAVASQTVVDGTRLDFHSYQISFTAPGLYDVTDTTTGAAVATNQAYASGSPIRIGGLEIVLADSPGAPAAGDAYAVTVTPPGQYAGDNSIQYAEIQPGTRVPLNVPGSQVFQGVGLPGGVDLFAIMNRVNTALAENDRTEISALLDELDRAATQTANEQAKVGARENLLTVIKDRQSEIKTSMDVLRSDLEDIDVADALTALTKQQNTYEATIGAASKIVQPSLLDFLR